MTERRVLVYYHWWYWK